MWIVTVAMGCGGPPEESDSDPPVVTDTAETGQPLVPTTETDCVATGTVTGCLVAMADCTANTALDGTPGGWFSDVLGEDTRIYTAPSPGGQSISFRVFGPRVLEPGESLAWGMEFSAEMVDTSGASTELWRACSGTLTVDEYDPGHTLGVRWSGVQFEVGTGVDRCLDVSWWDSEGVLAGASFWL